MMYQPRDPKQRSIMDSVDWDETHSNFPAGFWSSLFSNQHLKVVQNTATSAAIFFMFGIVYVTYVT